MQPPITLSARNRIIFCDPASHCYRHPVERWPSQMGGPKQIENLYTRAILEQAFPEFRVLSIVEEECEIHEGTSHGGMSAVINLTATKP